MPANSIDSDEYIDGSIDREHLAADIIDGTKIADDAIDSEHYTDGSIDLAHMSANSVDSDQYVDGSIDTVHIADNQITLAKMAGIARGKIIYGDASGDPAVLTAGSNGQVLTSDGTDISWAATPAASDTVAGVAELSTDAETITGTDTERVTTPANITAKMTAPGPIGGTTAAAASFTTISATGNITLGDAANINMSVPLLAGADHTFTGLSAQMLAGGTIAAFDLVCVHTITQEVGTADASAYATARVIGIAPAAISDTATGTVLLHGFIRDDTWAWTTGSTLYLSETAGAMTHTAPSTDGAFVQVVGVALSPDVVYINPSMDVIERA